MNTKLQFRVLYRQFLFRLMDVEFLSASARGDSNQLLGQFAALLLSFSLIFSLGAAGYGDTLRWLRPEEVSASVWSAEHVMIAITMLVTGIFAVLSWDSTFLDRRDVLVLAPLPVRGRTLFTAKIAAVASALGLAVAALNAISGLAYSIVLAPSGSGILGRIRFFAAFWAALLAAGAFLYCAILGVQGIAAQLTRKWYLRVSSFLQIAAFALFLGVFCLQPSLTNPKALAAPENQRALAWLPSYWFLGLLSELSGAFPAEGHVVMAPLAHRAMVGLLIAVCVAGGAFLLSYFRTLRKIVEEPDIAPGSHGGVWLPRFGDSRQTALVHFVVRTLARSRQHRVILAFFLGGPFALTTLCVKWIAEAKQAPGMDVLRQLNVPILVSSVLMLCACVLGTRVAFSLPLDLRANWLFRVMPVCGGRVCLSATRRALLTISVLPVWVACAALVLWLWPWAPAAQHLLLLGLFGCLLAEVSLIPFRKIPFTCSYLPGKSKVHIMFFAGVFVLSAAIPTCVELEQWLLAHPAAFWTAAVTLGSAVFAARRCANINAHLNGPEIQFEESASDELILLDLNG